MLNIVTVLNHTHQTFCDDTAFLCTTLVDKEIHNFLM